MSWYCAIPLLLAAVLFAPLLLSLCREVDGDRWFVPIK